MSDTYKAIPLGGTTGAHKRAVALADYIVKNNLQFTIPSYLAKWAADRCCSKTDIQSASLTIGGPLGSGKSLSSCYIAYRASQEFAERLGGKPEDYFTVKNNVLALGGNTDVVPFLKDLPPHSIVIMDDAGITAGSHSWMEKIQKGFIKVATTCRTARNFLIYTVPNQKQLDIGIRDMSDISLNIKRSYHEGGFNIITAVKSRMDPDGRRRFSKFIDDDGNKIGLFLAFKPPSHMMEEYNVIRAETAKLLLESESEKAKESVAPKVNPIEARKEERTNKIVEMLKANPTLKLKEVQAVLNMSREATQPCYIRAKIQLGLP